MNSMNKIACGVVAILALGCAAETEDIGSVQQALANHWDLGSFEASSASWYFDKNENGVWNGAPPDEFKVNNFGVAGDIVLSGFGQNWNFNTSCGFNPGFIGVWRPSTRQFYLDLNGNKVWNGTGVDIRVDNFMPAQAGFTDQPIIWTRTAVEPAVVTCFGVIGYFRTPNTPGGQGVWFIDYNGNRVWDGPVIDRQYNWGLTGHVAVPLARTWGPSQNRGSKLATFELATGKWFVDENHTSAWEGCTGGGDTCLFFGNPNNKPFSHPNGSWRAISEGTLRYVDLNNSGVWDAGDQAYDFGSATGQPFFF